MEYQRGTKVFGHWVITEEIGQGTYGKVYIVEKNEYGVQTKSALKVLTVPSSAAEIRSALSNGMDELSVTSYFKSWVENIMRECAVMSTLKSCENIVHFEDYTVIEHNPNVGNGTESIGWDVLIRMELLSDLDSYQMSHTMTEKEVIRMAKDILNALVYCEKKGIVHRDIKPSNILVSETGVYKLGDFGESRTMDRTIGATKRGTETYMAPEVYQNQPYGSNVDIYSLGLVMYKLMNRNRLPFYPSAGQMIKFTDTEIALKKRMDGEIPPAPVDAGEDLADIILHAIAPAKDSRYRKAGDMLEALNQLEMGKIHDFSNASEPSWDKQSETDPFENLDKTMGIFGDNFNHQTQDWSDVDKTVGVFGNNDSSTVNFILIDDEDAQDSGEADASKQQKQQKEQQKQTQKQGQNIVRNVEEYWKKQLCQIGKDPKLKLAFAPNISEERFYHLRNLLGNGLKANVNDATMLLQDVIGMIYCDDIWCPSSVYHSGIVVTSENMFIIVKGCYAIIPLWEVKDVKVIQWRNNQKKFKILYKDGEINLYGVTDKYNAKLRDYYNVDAIAQALLDLRS